MTDIKKTPRKICLIHRKRTAHAPRDRLILGSGLGSLAEQISDSDIIPYTEIPNFPVFHSGRSRRATGVRHPGRQTGDRHAGPFHFYEGYSLQDVTFPVRVMKLLGVGKLAVTNAAGAVNKDFSPGT